MHPPSSLGEGGGLRISEKSLLGGEGQKFLFWWWGVGGGYIVGGVNFVGGMGSRNFEVKIKTS